MNSKHGCSCGDPLCPDKAPPGAGNSLSGSLACSMREQFESWIEKPPYERDTLRHGDATPWPGQYIDIDVQLAWESWQAAKA